jgi:hypothetical protein
METPATNNTIAFLMASNNEDIAQDLANEITALKLELERVKEIAMHRLEVHAQRMTYVAERDADLARELASRFPLAPKFVTDAPKTREEAIENWKGIYRDQIETRPNQEREYHAARMTFVNGSWVTTGSV